MGLLPTEGNGFWITFGILLTFLVIIPLFFMGFTGEISLKYKILGTLLGAVGLFVGLKGKTIGRKGGFVANRR